MKSWIRRYRISTRTRSEDFEKSKDLMAATTPTFAPPPQPPGPGKLCRATLPPPAKLFATQSAPIDRCCRSNFSQIHGCKSFTCHVSCHSLVYHRSVRRRFAYRWPYTRQSPSWIGAGMSMTIHLALCTRLTILDRSVTVKSGDQMMTPSSFRSFMPMGPHFAMDSNPWRLISCRHQIVDYDTCQTTFPNLQYTFRAAKSCKFRLVSFSPALGVGSGISSHLRRANGVYTMSCREPPADLAGTPAKDGACCDVGVVGGFAICCIVPDDLGVPVTALTGRAAAWKDPCVTVGETARFGGWTGTFEADANHFESCCSILRSEQILECCRTSSGNFLYRLERASLDICLLIMDAQSNSKSLVSVDWTVPCTIRKQMMPRSRWKELGMTWVGLISGRPVMRRVITERILMTTSVRNSCS